MVLAGKFDSSDNMLHDFACALTRLELVVDVLIADLVESGWLQNSINSLYHGSVIFFKVSARVTSYTNMAR